MKQVLLDYGTKLYLNVWCTVWNQNFEMNSIGIFGLNLLYNRCVYYESKHRIDPYIKQTLNNSIETSE